MFNKYQAIRSVLKLVTFCSPVQPVTYDNQERFLISPRLPDDYALRMGLIKAYQQIFSEPPWRENWSEGEVLAKLERELTGNSFLVILRGSEDFPVGGFCWGRILKTSVLEDNIEPALESSPIGLEEHLLKKNKGDERILYFHEFAILRQFRRGLEPLRFLLRPSLEFGWVQGVRQTLFWSTSTSHIFPLSLYMGYEPILKIKVKGKEIIFLFNRDFSVLLKITQKMKERRVAKLMGFIAHLLK